MLNPSARCRPALLHLPRRDPLPDRNVSAAGNQVGPDRQEPSA